MPEGRAERAVEAYAKSMDDAEHSARLKRVMAGQEPARQIRHETVDVIVQ